MVDPTVLEESFCFKHHPAATIPTKNLNIHKKECIVARYTCGEIITITGLISYMKLVGGLNPSEKYEFVSWDYDNPNICKVIIHSMVPVTTNQ